MFNFILCKERWNIKFRNLASLPPKFIYLTSKLQLYSSDTDIIPTPSIKKAPTDSESLPFIFLVRFQAPLVMRIGFCTTLTIPSLRSKFTSFALVPLSFRTRNQDEAQTIFFSPVRLFFTPFSSFIPSSSSKCFQLFTLCYAAFEGSR